MIEFILEHGAGIIAGTTGGLLGVFMVIAHWRRVAVHRVMFVLLQRDWPASDAHVRVELLEELDFLGLYSTCTGEVKLDAPGRMIAASVKRVTKDA